MVERLPGIYPTRLTRAARYIIGALEELGTPAITQYDLFVLIQKMYGDQKEKKLYLRNDAPSEDNYKKLRKEMINANYINFDKDYGSRLIRIMMMEDVSAEEIVCISDPLCHISHLSAMQRWGLTVRQPRYLMCTRLSRNKGILELLKIMDKSEYKIPPPNFQMKYIQHPKKVRRRLLHVHESNSLAAAIPVRGRYDRLATVGQTFLDMVLKPELCGGMAHVIDVYEEHAEKYLFEAIEAIDKADNRLAKSRAGYILEEKLNIKNPKIDAWKLLGQRGGSRKLDPARPFAPRYSETWMISLNV